MTPCPPTAAIIAPTMPPISACDELDGMPSSQVSRFQMMPPTRPAKTSSRVTSPESTSPLAIVAATAVDRKAPTRFSDGRQRDGDLRLEGAAGDRGRHRVAGVVEAVREVERQGGDHDDDQEEQLKVHAQNSVGSRDSLCRTNRAKNSLVRRNWTDECSPAVNLGCRGAADGSRVPARRSAVTPSGSVTCISCRPHGSWRASRAIGTPRSASSFSVA